MALGTRRTPERRSPLLSGVVVQKMSANEQVLSTAGGVVTMTTDQLLGGMLLCDTQDAQTLTTPTAAAIVAAIPGCEIGTTVVLHIINHGDSTLTVGLGTGVVQHALAGTDSVLTIATVTAKAFAFRVTGVQAQGSTADAVEIIGLSASAASVS